MPTGVVDVEGWLDRISLGQYHTLFREHGIDGRRLLGLTESDLTLFGIPLGHRKKLLRAIATLRGETVAVAAGFHEGARPIAADDAATRVPGPERRQLTVVFCDMVDSSGLATRLDPEDLRDVMAAYLDTCTTVVGEFGGYIARYQGDGVLAYFGYPHAQEDAAERAVRAGRRLVEAVGQLSPRFDRALQVRVGIATGLVVVGDVVGLGGAREEVAIGGTPVLAARLQQMAEPDCVIIAEGTRRLLGQLFELEDLGLHGLKGIRDRTRAWRVVSERHLDSRFAGVHPEHAGPAVDRKAELALLLEQWQSACARRGRVVVLSGEAGIGKSRICAMLAEQVREAPHTLLWVQCSPFHASSALYPINVTLERLAGITADQSTATKLDRLEAALAPTGMSGALRLFATLLSIPMDDRLAEPAPELAPEPHKQRTLEALADWLVALSRVKPVLCILEDAHWIDPTTRELVSRCIERVASASVLLLITQRTQAHAAWPSHDHVSTMSLNRLARLHTAELVLQIAGTTLPPEVFDHIVTKTDGVPLFIEELTKAVIESELLRHEADRHTLSGPPPGFAIPTTLQDSLLARLDYLSPVKEIAQVCATIGREFSYQLLHALDLFPRGALDTALAQLTQSELIHSVGRPPDVTYVFKHALVRDAAYSTLLHSKRHSLHRRIAEVLERRFPDVAESQPELVAHHYTEAHLAKPAIDHWTRAGERAIKRSANVEAIHHFNRALDLLATLPESRERDAHELRLRTRLRVPLAITMSSASLEMEANYARRWVLAERLGATEEKMRVLLGRAAVTLLRSELDATLEQMDRLMQLAGPSTDPNELLASHYVISYARLARGELRAARDGIEQALAAYDHKNANAFQNIFNMCLVPYSTCPLFLTLQQLGYPDRAAELADHAVSEATRSGHQPTLAYVLYHQALFWMIGGDASRVRSIIAEMQRVIEKNDIHFARWQCEILLGWATAQSGAPEEGLQRMRQGEEAGRKLQSHLWRPFFLIQEAELLSGQHRHAEALDLLDRTEALIAEQGQRYAEPELHRVRAIALSATAAATSRIDTSLRRALDGARQQEAKLWELRAAITQAQIWRDRGCSDKGRSLLDSVHGRFTEGFQTPDLGRARTLLDELS